MWQPAAAWSAIDCNGVAAGAGVLCVERLLQEQAAARQEPAREPVVPPAAEGGLRGDVGAWIVSVHGGRPRAYDRAAVPLLHDGQKRGQVCGPCWA